MVGAPGPVLMFWSKSEYVALSFGAVKSKAVCL